MNIKLKKALNYLRRKKDNLREVIPEGKNCKHKEWCDWLNTSPFCLKCGWGAKKYWIELLAREYDKKR